ncbi:MAG: NAD-dependent epimerase/dehydratase family protein [Nocardioides sp.]
MRVLLLGGSWFVGRMVAQDAIVRGHRVTVFHRGVSGAPPTGARVVHGDRERAEDVRRLASHGPWDVVVDTAGSIPAVVGASSRILADVSERLVLVSTISAYRDWPHRPVDENSALWAGEPDHDPGTRGWEPDAYGPLKVGCEMAARRWYGDNGLLILRPHVVLGRYEYVGRLPWWLARMRRGGHVLTPGPDRPIQPIDVRDLSRFLIGLAETRVTGTFNVAAPAGRETFGDMLTACAQVVADESDLPPDLVWVDEDWLETQGVTQWTELPLWRNAPAPWSMNVSKALAAGLHCRPLADTVADTWRWISAGGQPVPHERFAQHGIDPAKEASLITRWLASG